ncbi:hypothetical protein COV94_01020, partial [Candidatus Woesearchaeota archaeon CG11_big_fil_rev_8_21_14_0_20_57_5]
QNAITLASRLLADFGLEGLHQADIDELRKVPGIGMAKASQLIAVFELTRRAQKPDNPSIQDAADVFTYCKPIIGHLRQEHLLALFLDVRNKVLGHEMIAKGTLDSCLAHPREIFRPAIQKSAKSVIIAHNHPSGDPTPSEEDQQLTRAIAKAGELIGIPLLDHIIIGETWERA